MQLLPSFIPHSFIKKKTSFLGKKKKQKKENISLDKFPPIKPDKVNEKRGI